MIRCPSDVIAVFSFWIKCMKNGCCHMPVPELVVQDLLALSRPSKLYIADCMGVGPSIKKPKNSSYGPVCEAWAFICIYGLILHLSKDEFKRFAALFVFIVQHNRLRSSSFWVKLALFVAAVINLTAAHVSESNNCSMSCQKWQRIGFQ